MFANSLERLEEHIDRHVRACLPRPGFMLVLTPVPMDLGSAEYCLALL